MIIRAKEYLINFDSNMVLLRERIWISNKSRQEAMQRLDFKYLIWMQKLPNKLRSVWLWHTTFFCVMYETSLRENSMNLVESNVFGSQISCGIMNKGTTVVCKQPIRLSCSITIFLRWVVSGGVIFWKTDIIVRTGFNIISMLLFTTTFLWQNGCPNKISNNKQVRQYQIGWLKVRYLRNI